MQEGKKAKTDDDDDLEDDLEDDDGEKRPLTTTFELNDTLYAEADLEDTDVVYLWLGVRICDSWHTRSASNLQILVQANVMLSYTIPEAIELLQSKLKTAQESLENHIEDLEYIREQVTIMEVNTARVFNWDVKRRRIQKEKAAEGKS